MKRFTSTLVAAMLATIGFSQVKINELMVNPPGTDNGLEFMELKGPANGSLNGYTILVIEGDVGTSGVMGIVDQAISLDGQSLGANGLLLIRDSAIVLDPAPAAQTNLLIRDFTPDVENGGNTFLVVTGFTGTVGTDLDANDDGILDSTPWTSVTHSFGWSEDSPNTPSLVYGTQTGGFDFPQQEFGPDAYVDYGATKLALDVLGTAPGPFEPDPLEIMDQFGTAMTLPVGFRLTPGSENPSASQVLAATAYNIVLGDYFGGDLASLASSDDNKLFILNDENTPNARVTVTSTGANQPATNFTVKIELGSGRSDLSTFIDAYNYTTNTYVNRDVHTSSGADVVRTIAVPLNASPVSGSGEVSVQVRWFPNEDLVAEDGWSEFIDQVEWTIE